MIANSSGRFKKTDYDAKDFIPKYINESQLPKSSPEIMRDRVAKYNKNHPNDMLKFDYDKYKN